MADTDCRGAVESESSACVWCLEAINGEPTTVGPTEHFRDSTAHTWPFHEECAAEWAECLQRLERIARAGGRHTLVDFPIRNGVRELYESD